MQDVLKRVRVGSVSYVVEHGGSLHCRCLVFV